MITLAELKTYLGIEGTDQDATLTLVVNAVNEYIEQITLRNYGDDKTRTEVHDYRDSLFLQRMGIKSITSVRNYQTGTEEQSDPLDTDSYTFNWVGRLTLDQNYGDDYNRGDYNAITVVYVYGKRDGEVVPADLKLAALQQAREFYEGTSTGDSRRVKSESTGSYRIEFADDSVFMNTLKRYRVPRV